MLPVSPVLPSNPDSQKNEIVIGKDQPEYLPLPCIALNDAQGTRIQRWRLSWRERLRVLIHGDIWLHQWSFDQRLQPIRPTVYEPFSSAEHKENDRASRAAKP